MSFIRSFIRRFDFILYSIVNKRFSVGRSKRAGGLGGGALSPQVGPGQSPDGGRGAKPTKIYEF